MKTKTKYTLGVLTGLVTSLALTSSVFASTICQPVYGGGQSCVTSGNIVIEKKVQTPGNANVFVDNLGVNDAKFAPDASINFLISITNTGSTQISRVTVKDYFPQEVTYVAGAGSYDANTKTLSFDLTNVNAGETRTFIVSTKAESAEKMDNKSTICDIQNKAAAFTDGSVEDIARFCIQKQVLSTTTVATGSTTKGGLKVFPPVSVKTTPATGPEDIATISLLASGAIGYFLRRRSAK